MYLIGSLRRVSENSSIDDVVLTVAPDYVDVLYDVLRSKRINQENQDIHLSSISLDKKYLVRFSKQYAAWIENRDLATAIEYEHRERFIGELDAFNEKTIVAKLACPIIEFNISNSEVYTEEMCETVILDNAILRFIEAPTVRRI
jgi:hypothetical protein